MALEVEAPGGRVQQLATAGFRDGFAACLDQQGVAGRPPGRLMHSLSPSATVSLTLQGSRAHLAGPTDDYRTRTPWQADGEVDEVAAAMASAAGAPSLALASHLPLQMAGSPDPRSAESSPTTERGAAPCAAPPSRSAASAQRSASHSHAWSCARRLRGAAPPAVPSGGHPARLPVTAPRRPAGRQGPRGQEGHARGRERARQRHERGPRHGGAPRGERERGPAAESAAAFAGASGTATRRPGGGKARPGLAPGPRSPRERTHGPCPREKTKRLRHTHRRPGRRRSQGQSGSGHSL